MGESIDFEKIKKDFEAYLKKFLPQGSDILTGDHREGGELFLLVHMRVPMPKEFVEFIDTERLTKWVPPSQINFNDLRPTHYLGDTPTCSHGVSLTDVCDVCDNELLTSLFQR